MAKKKIKNSSHWMYRTVASSDCLYQGDLIKRGAKLTSLLKKYYKAPYISKYPYYAVLTQSCDLAYREQRFGPKAVQIQLCAVEPLKTVVSNEIYQQFFDMIDRDYLKKVSQKKIDNVVSEVEKIINCNSIKYFFYPEDGSLDTKCIARFDVSVSLDSKHIDECILPSKVIELSEAHRAKFGYNVADLYGRVAAPDFFESAPKAILEISKEVREVLVESFGKRNIVPHQTYTVARMTLEKEIIEKSLKPKAFESQRDDFFDNLKGKVKTERSKIKEELLGKINPKMNYENIVKMIEKL